MNHNGQNRLGPFTYQVLLNDRRNPQGMRHMLDEIDRQMRGGIEHLSLVFSESGHRPQEAAYRLGEKEWRIVPENTVEDVSAAIAVMFMEALAKVEDAPVALTASELHLADLLQVKK